MDKKRKLLVIVLAFVLVVGGASVIYSLLGESMAPDQLTAQTQQQDGAAVPSDDPGDGETGTEKTAAPDFVVYDADGGEVRLSDFIGKPTVLNFWASWCGPCQREMPDFHEKYLELGDDINFLMVNMTTGRETKEKAMSFVEEGQYSFPVFYDTQSSAAIAYGVYSLPTTYFIDADGYIVVHATGAIDADTLQQGIDMIAP